MPYPVNFNWTPKPVVLPWEQLIPKMDTNDWCTNNCVGEWARDRIFKIDEAMYFEKEEDRVKFILRWL